MYKESYHNTTGETGQTFISFNEGALTQEQVVFEVFKKVGKACWFEIKNHLPDMNESSLKRSITNLKVKGLLFKTSDKVIGTAGKPCFKYQLC
jgi:hypothetical protein